MTTKSNLWTRRAFSQTLALSAGSAVLSRSALAFPVDPWSRSFVYVGASPSSSQGSITVFRQNRASWQDVQTIPAASPAHLEQHPFLPVLYVVHDVALWEHRPRGAVSAYAIDPATGTLTLRICQPLSLSATNPNHAVVSADGRDLVVAARGGGSYNVLPISADGSLGPPRIIRKEVGAMQGVVASLAKPSHLLRHSGGRFLLAADPGARTLTAFSIRDEALEIVSRTSAHKPVQITFTQSGKELVVMHSDGSMSTRSFDPESASIGSSTHTASAALTGHVLLASHPHAPFLVTAGSSDMTGPIVLWQTSGDKGLRSIGTLKNHGPLSGLIFSPDGRNLLLAERNAGRIVSIDFNPATAAFGDSMTLAHLDGVRCFAFQRA